MTNTPAPHERRLQNFVNRGIVTHIDYKGARCRVQIDSLVTDWLPFSSTRLGSVKIWNPPCVGEQVMIISETGELVTGLIIAAFDYDAHPMPSTNENTIEMHCKDGAVFSYNHAIHSLQVTLPNDSTTQITSNRVTLDADDVAINCNRYHVDCHDYSIQCKSYRLDSDTNSQNGKLTINGQPYLSHSHKNVKVGSSNSGGVNG